MHIDCDILFSSYKGKIDLLDIPTVPRPFRYCKSDRSGYNESSGSPRTGSKQLCRSSKNSGLLNLQPLLSTVQLGFHKGTICLSKEAFQFLCCAMYTPLSVLLVNKCQHIIKLTAGIPKQECHNKSHFSSSVVQCTLHFLSF